MDFKALLENKKLLYGTIGAAVLIVVLVIVMSMSHGTQPNGSASEQVITDKPIKLLTTDNIGKALELQALMARENINIDRVDNGNKSELWLNKYKLSEKDRALLAIVESGIMDEHVGLEIFDKGDFTSTKEDKRIRLARAINGELSRLIRQIPPIENASVFISIPTPTIFTSQQKPTTATVQLKIPSGDRLTGDKIKAITNLLLGSVEGIESKNISITDTNGNVYSSLIQGQDNIMDELEENDKYMKNKVMAQLDRLIGKDKYVVTVSTFLRQTPVETNQVLYDPQKKAVLNEQKFSEGLGDSSSDKNSVTSAVSTYLPKGLGQGPDSSSNRNYNRRAEELQYGVSKTQITEYKNPGIIEEISVAVTIDQGAIPSSVNIDELKTLIARAASPKVDPQNVEIAFSDEITPYLASDMPVKTPAPEDSGNPWWTAAVALGIMLIGGLVFIAGRVKSSAEKSRDQIENLMRRSSEQESMIEQMNAKAASMIAQQREMQQVASTQQQVAQPVQQISINDSIEDLRENLESEYNEDLAYKLKTWIESSE